MNNKQMRDEWIQFIADSGPYRFMLTVTYKYSLPDDKSIQYFDKLLHFVNRKLYGMKYKRKGIYLKGFVFAERNKRGALHFHILVKDDAVVNQFSRFKFEQLVYRFGAKIEHTSKSGHGYQVINNEGLDVADIYDEIGIADYLTKTMKMSESCFIGPLGADGSNLIKENIRR
ncbi:MAG: hypothetical protein K1562_15775 [Candidatus Thiodiazotropha sp. (ex. Lucinisca nassula)]|nr:hypothetical protein [Candidatus Thiodiazotropha sp. (ex. Lucinisca nassula)]